MILHNTDNYFQRQERLKLDERDNEFFSDDELDLYWYTYLWE